jgi:hypothetical protein
MSNSFRKSFVAALAGVLCAGALFAQTADVAPVAKQPIVPREIVQGCTGFDNDNCANAIAITSTPYNDTRDTTCTTDEPGEPQSTCTLASKSIWYTYTNGDPFPQTVNIDLTGSNFDTTVMVWSGTCGAFFGVACNDDANGTLQSEVGFLADPGVTYYIQIAGFDGDSGIVVLNVTSVGGLCPLESVVSGFSGSFTQDGRIFRDGIPSACPSKVYPGGFGAGTTFNYETYTYTNPTPNAACITVNFNPDTAGATPCGPNAHASAYLGSYDPTNQAANYVGDVGSSLTQAFSFEVPGDTDFLVVVTNTSAAATCTFGFDIVGIPCEQQPSVLEVPTVDHRGLIVLAVVLAALAVVVIRRVS